MRFLVGTSGYSYPQWKGSFYPEKLPAKEMLAFYAARFAAVEINNSFYRLPKLEVVQSWAAQAPAGFQFVLKASQSITHYKRLKDAEEATELMLALVAALGEHQGPLLLQLHPTMKKDVARLEAFLRHIGDRARVALEARHESWFADDVFDCLGRQGAALCHVDAEEHPAGQLVSTADWGYVRLRRAKYTRPQLAAWVERLRSQPWQKAYVFFKHEETGTGPKWAKRFQEAAGQRDGR